MIPQPNPSPAIRPAWWRRPAPFWIAVAILTTLLRAPALFVEVLDPDEAGHAVNAWVWMAGGTPYVDFVDNKQPLVYAAYRGVFALFGRTLVAVHAVTIPWLLLTAWLIGRIASRLWPGVAASRAAVLMFTLASVAYLEKDMLSTNTEVLMNFPLVAAFWAVVSSGTRGGGWRAAAGGGLAAAALLFNLKAAFALPALMAAVVASPLSRRWQRGLLLFAAFSAALAAAAWWFWSRGALAPFVSWNIVHNLTYAGVGVNLGYAGYSHGIVYGYPRLLVFAASTAPIWLGAIAACRRTPDDSDGARALRVAFALWAAGSVAAVCLGGRFYGHYFIQLIPPLVLLACGPVSSLRNRAPALQALAVAGLVLPVCAWTLAGYARIAGDRLDALKPPIREVADAVRKQTRPGDRIFVWGSWPQLYYHARRLPASRFVFPQSLAGYVPGNPATLEPGTRPDRFIVAGHWRQFAEDVARHPARVIVDTAPAAVQFWERYPVDRYPVLRDLLERRYVRAAVVKGVVIYRLRDGTE